jgi:hypothetical protein
MLQSKFVFVYLFLFAFVSGCSGLSDEDKERVASAEENLEDIALAPKITTPSEDEEIEGMVDVYVDVDTNYLDRYSTMTLFIEGRPELVDDEYPFEFSFNSYFWSDDDRISLLAKIETHEGNELRSEIVSVPLSSTANQVIALEGNVDGKVIRSSAHTNISWGAVVGAIAYEYQVNDQQTIRTVGTNADIVLQELGSYTVRVRAVDENQRTGPWSSDATLYLLGPESPLIASPSGLVTYRSLNTIETVWEHQGDELSFEYQLDNGENETTSDFTILLENLSLGNHAFRVRTIDVLGHSSQWSEVFFRILAPVAPTIQSPSTAVSYQDLGNLEASWEYDGDGLTFEYQLNNEPAESTEDQVATLEYLEPGSHEFRVRSVDALGYASPWSEVSFNLITPITPIISSLDETDTESAFQLNVELESEYPQTTVEIATDVFFTGSSIVQTSSSDLTHEIELTLGTYFVRAKAQNEFGHESEWTSTQEVTIGLFAVAINMAHGGWDDYDQPTQLLIDGNRLIVAANAGPSFGDASGDSLYMTKVDTKGNKDWSTGLVNQAQSIKSISLSEDGYLVSSRAPGSWRSSKLLRLSKDSGNVMASHIFSEDTSVGGDPNIYTSELLYGTAELTGGEIVALRETSTYEKTGEWSSTLQSKTQTLDVLNLDLVAPVVDTFEFPEAPSGEYKNISQLLVDEDKLFAVGLYDAGTGDASDDFGAPTQSSSGAVVFEVSKADGSINEANTATMSGIGGSYSFDAALTEDSSIHVAYQNYYSSPVSAIDATRQVTDFYSNSSIRYGEIAIDNDNYAYLVGESVNTYGYASVTKYLDGNYRQAATLSRYSRELSIKDVIYDDRYGIVVLGIDESKFFNASSSDEYTVIFNITEELDYLAPSELIFDYGN